MHEVVNVVIGHVDARYKHEDLEVTCTDNKVVTELYMRAFVGVYMMQ